MSQNIRRKSKQYGENNRSDTKRYKLSVYETIMMGKESDNLRTKDGRTNKSPTIYCERKSETNRKVISQNNMTKTQASSDSSQTNLKFSDSLFKKKNIQLSSYLSINNLKEKVEELENQLFKKQKIFQETIVGMKNKLDYQNKVQSKLQDQVKSLCEEIYHTSKLVNAYKTGKSGKNTPLYQRNEKQEGIKDKQNVNQAEKVGKKKGRKMFKHKGKQYLSIALKDHFYRFKSQESPCLPVKSKHLL